MKKIIFAIVATAVFANTNAQNGDKQKIADFNAVEVHAASHIELMQGDTNYVSISSKDSAVKAPKMNVMGGMLEINSSFHQGKIIVHIKNIKYIKVDEAAKVTCLDTLSADNLVIRVADAGSAQIMVHAKNLHVQGSDASSITLAGSADSLHAKETDASHLMAYDLKSRAVHVRSADGSEADVWAVNSIDGNATDGSSIHIKGTPAQKNTSVSDGGTITMDATGEEITPDHNNENMQDSGKSSSRHKKRLVVNDAFIGGGFVTGGTQAGLPVKYGASREFILGFGWEKKLVKWNGVGLDLYYKSTDFYLKEDSAKTFPTKVQHQQEKISFQNFGGLIFDRFHFGKNIYLDGGFYFDWTFHSKYITWDGSTPDASSTKAIERNINYVSWDNYGLTFRFGSTKGLSAYFSYRLSNLFNPILDDTRSPPGAVYSYNPEPPACTIGITLGGF